jgi:hypothetical protein
MRKAEDRTIRGNCSGEQNQATVHFSPESMGKKTTLYDSPYWIGW